MVKKQKGPVEEVEVNQVEDVSAEVEPEVEEPVDEPEEETEEEPTAPVALADLPVTGLMKISVNALRQAVELLAPVAPRKTALPVLTHIRLQDGMATATDLDTAVMVSLPEATEACLLPARQVTELLKYVGGFLLLTIECRRGKVSLIWDGGKATYDVPDPHDYPDIKMPEVSEDAQASVDGEPLVTALLAALPYCATDEKRPVLAGITLYLGEKLTVAAADGFRLSYQVLDMAFPIESIAIIPARAIRILELLWKRVPPEAKPVDDLIAAITAKRQIRLGVAKEHAVMWLPKVTLVTKLIEGTPPNFEQLIPKDGMNTMLVFAGDLERGLLRLKNIAKPHKDIVRLSWGDGNVNLAAGGGEEGAMETTVPAETDQPGKVALSVSYLLAYLKGKTDLMKMVTTDHNRPVLLQYKNTHKVVIMPMNVEW